MGRARSINQPDAPRMAYSPKETAQILGIGLVTLFNLLKDQKLKRLKIGRRTLIPAADLERFMRDLDSQGGEAA